MKLIIGYNGLVGQSILKSRKFDHYFNSKNIDTFIDIAKDGDDLFLCCLPAEKWLINNNIKKDIDNIYKIINILSVFKFNKIELISTIDVYNESPPGSDEDFIPVFKNLNYGSNRYLFEVLVKSVLKYNNLKIFRLPALFNNDIKKNILFDLLNNNNIDKINVNSSYQWYNLEKLNSDISKLSELYSDNTVFNIFTEPIETIDIIDLFNIDLKKQIYERTCYNFKTKFSPIGYLYNKEETIKSIKEFINGYSNK